ncbi:hypothetical protein SNOG_15690 [Parastagonospora nodorum SN15]|uniref:Uncharacterized protein n=1 Tax=Phaeosphaeria nodorum (strain SN15 / ATCC MYA-4574 / FGSC 10173) TaxID=321614 RepID=Q0TY60_PHANO|nr:hypothetical protein SNOG_15690 [Parastagonospora nodorum SN15]EAT77065.1 hypothetical protein SNOG_15690 [Parastagonospora nodorum SN15]
MSEHEFRPTDAQGWNRIRPVPAYHPAAVKKENAPVTLARFAFRILIETHKYIRANVYAIVPGIRSDPIQREKRRERMDQ